MRSYSPAVLVTLTVVGLLVMGMIAHAQKTKTRFSQPSKAKLEQLVGKDRVIKPMSGAGRFKVVHAGGKPVFVTFNQCHNAAKESCGHGIESLDHEEESGDCAFSCLAAPSSSD